MPDTVRDAVCDSFYESDDNVSHDLQAAVGILQPLHFFFLFLYYTDAGSTAAILAAYLVRCLINLTILFPSDLCLGCALPETPTRQSDRHA